MPNVDGKPFLILATCWLSFYLSMAGVAVDANAADSCIVNIAPEKHDGNHPDEVALQFVNGQNGGSVTLMGVPHFRFMDVATVKRLTERVTAEFSGLRPDIAYFEGYGTQYGIDPVDSTEKAGEAGLLRFLASRTGVEALSLEPSRSEVFQSLVEEFPRREVIAFFIARRLVQYGYNKLQADLKRSDEQSVFERVGQQVLSDAGDMTNDLPFDDFIGLLREQYDVQSIAMIKASWFDPRLKGGERSGLFAKINNRENIFRNTKLIKLIEESIENKRRAFVLIGRDHVHQLNGYFTCKSQSDIRLAH